MKTPSFWQSKNLLSTLLLPLSAIYTTSQARLRWALVSPIEPAGADDLHRQSNGGRIGQNTGGACISEQCSKIKICNAFFLSRGYGGMRAGPLLVDPKKHTAREVGDEPLLLAGLLPTVVAKNRVDRCAFCHRARARRSSLWMTGSRIRPLLKSLSLLVIDGQIGVRQWTPAACRAAS